MPVKRLCHKYPGASLPVKGLSDELNRILSKALAKDPEERYQSARQMVNDLDAVLPSDVKRPRRRPLISFSPVLGVLLGLILGLALGVPLGMYVDDMLVTATPTAIPTAVPTVVPTTEVVLTQAPSAGSSPLMYDS